MRMKLSHWNAKNTVSLIYRLDKNFKFYLNYIFLLACGNNVTRDKDSADKNQTWPFLAVAVNEISSVHCTATISMLYLLHCIMSEDLILL